MTLIPEAPARTLPRHVAVAMDGNGRWARKRGLPRSAGHRAGADRILDLVRATADLGIGHLSVYGFSTENWRRAPAEVTHLMNHARTALRHQRGAMHAMNVRVRWSGRAPRLWPGVLAELRAAEELTAGNTGLTVYLCVNYGGQAELSDAAAAIARAVGDGALDPSAIDEHLFARGLSFGSGWTRERGLVPWIARRRREPLRSIGDRRQRGESRCQGTRARQDPNDRPRHLYQPDAPDVDLFLRPSGEQRTSNFLPWQLAFAEMVFLDVLWPDFEPAHLRAAVDAYASRRAASAESQPR